MNCPIQLKYYCILSNLACPRLAPQQLEPPPHSPPSPLRASFSRTSASHPSRVSRVDLAPTLSSPCSPLSGLALERPLFGGPTLCAARVAPGVEPLLLRRPPPYGLARTAFPHGVGTTRVGPAVAKLPRFRLAPMSSLRRHVTCLTQSTGPGLRDERRLY